MGTISSVMEELSSTRNSAQAFSSNVLIDLRIAPQARYARFVRSAVSSYARNRGVSETDLEQFLTALGEALANAIEHAKTERPIRIRCRLDEGTITATVADAGIGFPPGSRPITHLPPPMSENGRGLPLMRRCSDIFRVRSVPGKGTAVLLGRRLLRKATLQHRLPHEIATNI
jgi:serine/threonine-protein kinase RsbW